MINLSGIPHDDIVAALGLVRPGGDYVLRGSVLEWLDAVQPAPTQAEVAAAAVAVARHRRFASARQRVAAFADQLALAVTGPIPEAERASWPTKEAAARAVIAGAAATHQTAMLAAEADLTGETVLALAQRIVINAESYVRIAGMIAGQRRATLAALDALDPVTATDADVEAVLAAAKAQAEAMLAQITAGT